MKAKKPHIKPEKGFRAKQALGQHFLNDKALLEELVALSGIERPDHVFEIGPGLGALTEALAKKAGRVLAMEVDPQLIPVLRVTLHGLDHVEVIQGDIMGDGLEELLLPLGPFKIAANLPYYITTPIMNRLLRLELPIRSINVMVQKEAAEHLIARPSTPAYGPLALLAQYKSEPRIVKIIGSEAFTPPPKCDSAFVTMPMRETPPVQADEKKLFSLIDAAFRMRRKTLVNNLMPVYSLSRSQAEELVQKAGLPAGVRGEALSLEEFAALTNLL